MRRYKTTVLLAIISMLVVVFLAPSVGATPQDWRTREGTVGWALSLQDGTHVYLDAVIIDKIRAHSSEPYFTIRECFYAADRLVILSPPSTLLRMGQLVDVEGNLTTLPNGDRGLQNVTIWGYTDEDGTLLTRGGPLCKGIWGPTEWDYKVDLTVTTSTETTATEPGSSDEPNATPAEGPTHYSSISDILESSDTQTQGVRTQSYYDGIPEVRGLPDGSFVELQAKGISAAGTQQIGGITYNYFDMIENSPATDTIRCFYSESVPSTSRVNRVSGQIRHLDLETPVIDIDTGPAGYDPQDPGEGQLQTAAQGTIAWAKTFPNSTLLPVALADKVVSRAYPSAGYFYIQEPMRWSGIRVYDTTAALSVQPGTTVTVSGTISSQDGERKLTPSSVTTTGSTDQPRPLGLNNKTLGGGDFNVYTTGITGASGLNNVGLLARIWGRVTSVGSNYFYLDDGSNVDNGGSNPGGVKVSWAWQGSQDGNPPITAPEEDWYVCVTGISSSEISGSQTVRVLRLRRQEDMQVAQPEDNANPYVSMTTPADGEIHKASSQSTVRLAGSATDADTGIASVQVGFTTAGLPTEPTNWYTASYNSATSVWTYDWQNSTTQKIWVKATDFAMHTTTISRDVTVSTITSVKYVRQNGTGTKDGSSWDNAEDKVGDAINKTGVTEVWVAQGVYPESITLKAGVAVYGGFAPTDTYKETYREQRNWAVNKTVLDGNSASRVVTGGTGATAANTIIDGFTIQNGKASQGAGIYFSSNAATVSHNIIKLNKSLSTASGSGAGIYCSGASPVIANNWIIGNVIIPYSGTDPGGAIYLSNSNATIINNTIAHNSAGRGGAICMSGSTYSPTIINNIIALNSSGMYVYSGTPSVTYNDVWGNANDASDSLYWKLGNPETNHNISADPLFANSAYGDVRIKSDSPCKNTGLDTVTLPDSLDISGNNRKNGLIDMGANEWTVEPVSVPLVVRVKPDGSDSNDGSSWTLAKKTIQAAITDAWTRGGGDVWVKGAPDLGLVYNEAISLRPFVHLYGGFDEDDTTRSDRNWRDNLTAIDASGLGLPVVTVDTVPMLTSTLDGFTITHGDRGIKFNYGSAVVNHNIIKGNVHTGQGGGIYGWYSQPVIANNWIAANASFGTNTYGSAGGGINVYACQGVSILNNTIVGNTALGPGGIYVGYCPLAAVTNNIVAYNTSGIQFDSSSTATAQNNDLYGNVDMSSYLQPGSNGNISANPGFVDIDHCDFHITGSGCKNVGLDTVSLPDALDIDGGSRRNGQIDIGADEWNGADPSPIAPKVIRVKPDGDDANDGSSWTLAKRTIQKALNAASDAGSGEVWVESGSTYDGSITLRPFVHLYGGFDEDDTVRSDRDWGRIATTIHGSGDVVTSQAIPNQWSTIDGFTITGGGRGIYLNYSSGIIAHNIIKDNTSSSNGAGINCNYSAPTIANNFIVGNTASGTYYGGGLYLYYSNASILNNTIAKNTGATAGGLYIYGGNPTVTNNIVASNSSGVYLGGTSTTPTYNDVWGNTGGSSWQPATTENGPPDTNGNIIKDPKFIDADNKDVHILWTSGCKDAGLNTVSLPDSFDIDKEARRNGTIDIGADETTECRRYILTLTTEATQVPVSTSVMVTARVWDVVDNAPEAGYQVNFSVNAGEILSISPNGQVNQPPTSGFGTTNAEGYVYAYVTRDTDGRVIVTADIAMCDSSVAKNVQINFGNAEANLVFIIDVTGSTSSGEEIKNGVKATVDYLYAQLQAQGRQLRVAGIKFSDYYPNLLDPALPHSNGELRDFATLVDANAVTAFKNWVDVNGPGGGTEYQLDILTFAKDMAPDASPGLYIALGTDENSDSTLNKQTVANALIQSGSIVFIDPGQQSDPDNGENLILYYQPLAVNGGAVESSIGTFTFPLMRQAILGTP